MRTNIVLNEKLVKKAFKLSDYKTKKDLVNAALEEFVIKRDRKDIRDLIGKIKFHDGYDYKKMR